MRFTAIAIAAVASLSSFAMADNCQEGLNYCGYVLMRKGNYYAQIVQALEDEGLLGDPSHVTQTLFHCNGGDNGEIVVEKECWACQDGGDNHSDVC